MLFVKRTRHFICLIGLQPKMLRGKRAGMVEQGFANATAMKIWVNI